MKNTLTSYNGNTTTVTNDAGDSSQFVQNSLGITTSIINPDNFESEIELTASNNVAALRHNGSLRGTFTFDSFGNPERLVRYDPEGEIELTYIFDWEDRNIALSDTDGNYQTLNYDVKGNLISRTWNGNTIQYGFNDQGDLISQSEGGTTTTYAYNDDGLLSQLENEEGTSQFAYNTRGRLASITFPDGTEHEYAYDALGFRTGTIRPDGSFQDFDYDATGNLTDFQSIGILGDPIGQSITLNNDNQVSRVEFQPQGQLDIQYHADGNPKTLDWGDQVMQCEYDASGRLTSIESDVFGTNHYQYSDGEADIRKQLDERTLGSLVNQRRASNTFGSSSDIHYARSRGVFGMVVNWNEALQLLDIPTDIGLINPDSLILAADQRRRIYNALAQEPMTQRQFDKASNSFFLPPEYESVNCVTGITAYPTLNVPSTAFTGVPVNIEANVAWTTSNCGLVLYFFYANGSYIGGGVGGLSKTITHTFTSAGYFTISVSVMCTFVDSGLKSASATLPVECDAPQAPSPMSRPAWVTAPHAELPFSQVGALGKAIPAINNETNQDKPACSNFCVGGSIKWLITGGAEGNLSTKIATNLPIPNSPGQFKNRTQAQINATKTHEGVHISEFEALEVPYHNTLDGNYNSAQSCAVGLAAANDIFDDDVDQTCRNECLHVNHSGEDIFTVDPNGNQIPTGLTYPLTSEMPGYSACQVSFPCGS